jgi:ribosomal protein S18 acetylase RimI-like enzyme
VPDSVTIRRVTAEDGGRSRALRLEMLADTPLAFITTLAQAAEAPHAEFASRCAKAASGDEIAQFVAETGRRMVGQAIGMSAPGAPDRTLLVAVYISPAFRGLGILDALVEAVAAWSRGCGRDALDLEVVTGNARAIRAYAKLGFLPVGETVSHPTIPGLREQWMTRAA